MYAHNLSSMLAFTALAVATFVFVRRFARARRPGWAAYSAATGVVSLGLFFWPDQSGISLRLAVASVLMFAWVAAVCMLVLSQIRHAATAGPATATVTSADGTPIAYEMTGSGPALVLVGGAFRFRRYDLMVDLANLLAPHFTVYSYDRRGRGDSGDTQPYAVEREIEDLDAVIAVAGGNAFVWGLSSGGGLALEAARAGSDIRALAVYEAPYRTDRAAIPTAELAATLERHLAAGDRGAAVRYFLTKGMGMPAPAATTMRLMRRTWARLSAVAHTLPYDVAIMAPSLHPGSVDRFAGLRVPGVLMAGTRTPELLKAGTRALADAAPEMQVRWLPGQNHVIKPALVAPEIVAAFAEHAGSSSGTSRIGDGADTLAP